MKTRSVRISIMSFVVLMTVVTTIFSQGKELPFSSYPKEYDTLTSKNWSQIKSKLNAFLKVENLDSIRKGKKPNEIRFLLTRMAFIDWSSSQKKEVTGYLAHFAEDLLQGKNYQAELSDTHFSTGRSANDLLFIPYRAIWVMVALDKPSACTVIEYLFKMPVNSRNRLFIEKIRELSVRSLNEKYKSNTVVNCIKLLQQTESCKANDKIARETGVILLKNKLFLLNNQEKAWDYLWEQVEDREISGVFTKKNQFAWYSNILYMKDIYGDPDLDALFRILEKTNSTAKKYVFLYTVCFGLNTKLSGLKTDATLTFAVKAKTMVENLYHDSLTEIPGGPENSDILGTTFGIMKKQMEK